MEIDTKKATSSEFNIEASYSTASFEEVSCIDEKMKCYQITMKQALNDIKPLSICDKMRTTWKR